MSEQLTYNQINEQLWSAQRRQDQSQPTVLIDHPDGQITTGWLNPETYEVVSLKDGQWQTYLEASANRLSDQHQEMLARNLAATAFGNNERATGPSQAEVDAANLRVQELWPAGFSAADRGPVWQYAQALRPEEAAYWLGQVSEAGKANAQEYGRLFNIVRQGRPAA